MKRKCSHYGIVPCSAGVYPKYFEESFKNIDRKVKLRIIKVVINAADA